jgi:NADH dehydrogenase
LLARGQKVRALVRPVSNGAALQQAGAEVVAGDLIDPAGLAPACAGVDTVVTTASVTRTGGGTIEAVDRQGTLDLIAAAQAAGVGHFVYVSTIGASPESPVPVFRAKGDVEARLKASGLPYTILQPNAFMDVWFGALVEAPALAGRPVTLVGESRRRHSFVAEQDVAAFAVAATHVSAARNATILIGGPEALTFREVVQAYEAALGRPIAIQSVAPGQPIPGVPDAVSGIAAALESYDSAIPMDDTARTYGVPLTDVRSFARLRVAAATTG